MKYSLKKLSPLLFGLLAAVSWSTEPLWAGDPPPCNHEISDPFNCNTVTECVHFVEGSTQCTVAKPDLWKGCEDLWYAICTAEAESWKDCTQYSGQACNNSFSCEVDNAQTGSCDTPHTSDCSPITFATTTGVTACVKPPPGG